LASWKTVQFLKGLASRLLQEEFPALRKGLRAAVCGCVASIAGASAPVDEKAIREDIENPRWDEDVDGFKITAPTEP